MGTFIPGRWVGTCTHFAVRREPHPPEIVEVGRTVSNLIGLWRQVFEAGEPPTSKWEGAFLSRRWVDAFTYFAVRREPHPPEKFEVERTLTHFLTKFVWDSVPMILMIGVSQGLNPLRTY